MKDKTNNVMVGAPLTYNPTNARKVGPAAREIT